MRFSRKTREQYVMSEKDGKPTQWMANYKSGRWIAKTVKADGKDKD